MCSGLRGVARTELNPAPEQADMFAISITTVCIMDCRLGKASHAVLDACLQSVCTTLMFVGGLQGAYCTDQRSHSAAQGTMLCTQVKNDMPESRDND